LGAVTTQGTSPASLPTHRAGRPRRAARERLDHLPPDRHPNIDAGVGRPLRGGSMTGKLTVSRKFHIAREGLGRKRFREGEEAARPAGRVRRVSQVMD
jgi:hypothetical protein